MDHDKHKTGPWHDDPRIDASSYRIAEAMYDDWGRAVIHGLGNHFANRMTADGTWNHVAPIIRNSPARAMRADCGETTFRSFLTAGRCLMTLSREGGDQISFLAYEHDDNGWWGGAVQSVEAPLSVALAMIEDAATRMWTLVPDEKARIA